MIAQITITLDCPNCRKEFLYEITTDSGKIAIDCPNCDTVITVHSIAVTLTQKTK